MQITLFVPDLGSACANHPLQRRLPVLETLFTRARTQPARGDSVILAEIFDLAATEFAPAPFMRLADSGQRDSGFYFCADPVHLAPDRDQLLMLPLSVMQVQMEEAATLAETFNHMYEAEGYRLETPQAGRWYLRYPAVLNCITHEPAKVAGQAVFDFMPSGKDGSRLKQLMNEIQMLFFEHPVNLAREAAGKPAINSLWLWGGGYLPEEAIPEKTIKTPKHVVTNMPLVAGLARFAGSECTSWPSKSPFSKYSGDVLIGINSEGERGMAPLEEQLAVPLLHALRHGQISEAILYPGNKQGYRVTQSSLRRFWRRRRPLSEILGTA
ncbi:MAG: hypothetical protein ACRER7_06110 [Gammaproteobacteria bacterium]